jgi:hypothetical protein
MHADFLTQKGSKADAVHPKKTKTRRLQNKRQENSIDGMYVQDKDALAPLMLKTVDSEVKWCRTERGMMDECSPRREVAAVVSAFAR